MIRARFVFAATLVSAGLAAGSASAQAPAPAAPDFKPILAGKNFKPPVRGVADVEFTKPPVKRRGRPGRRRVQGEEHVERSRSRA